MCLEKKAKSKVRYSLKKKKPFEGINKYIKYFFFHKVALHYIVFIHLLLVSDRCVHFITSILFHKEMVLGNLLSLI